MPKPPSTEFAILVDSSCLTDSTDLKMPSKRNDSGQTVIHHEIEDGDGSTTDRLRKELEEQSDDDVDDQSQMSSQLSSNISTDSHTEALIQAAARAVVASMEQNGYEQEEDSVLSSRTEEGYDGGTELTYEEGSALTYGDGTDGEDEDVDHSGHEQDLYDGSASSHHEDDVFSQGNRHSNRSSLNSISDEDLHGANADQNEKEIPNRRQSEGQESISPQSRAPSHTSTTYSLLPDPLTINGTPKPHTPSKVLSRPPFRTPSSVRALQMSSPTPSLFSSPRSSKRPTVSRLGTPHAPSPSKTKTPTRFKVKKEYPLVLLHVTVLPLRWVYADAMDAMPGEGLPRELHGVRESWKLLKEKLGDTVLERGILLPHPQDSYEVLEERLLEALELPVRPRAKILSCGHYMGPDEAGISSEEENDSEHDDDDIFRINERERWCDICLREVRYESFGIGGKQKRFRVKVYASNGLMRSGAWAAAWREMERVDIEIEPFVQSHLVQLMDSLAASHAEPADVFVLQPVLGDNAAKEIELKRKEMEEERMREVYGAESRPASKMSARPSRIHSNKRSQYGDSLPDLMLAAFKVAMRDKKNVALFVLSLLVLLLAFRPGFSSEAARNASMHHSTMNEALGGILEVGVEKAVEIPDQIVSVVNAVTAAVKPTAIVSSESASIKEEILKLEELAEVEIAQVVEKEDVEV